MHQHFHDFRLIICTEIVKYWPCHCTGLQMGWSSPVWKFCWPTWGLDTCLFVLQVLVSVTNWLSVNTNWGFFFTLMGYNIRPLGTHVAYLDQCTTFCNAGIKRDSLNPPTPQSTLGQTRSDSVPCCLIASWQVSLLYYMISDMVMVVLPFKHVRIPGRQKQLPLCQTPQITFSLCSQHAETLPNKFRKTSVTFHFTQDVCGLQGDGPVYETPL